MYPFFKKLLEDVFQKNRIKSRKKKTLGSKKRESNTEELTKACLQTTAHWEQRKKQHRKTVQTGEQRPCDTSARTVEKNVNNWPIENLMKK